MRKRIETESQYEEALIQLDALDFLGDTEDDTYLELHQLVMEYEDSFFDGDDEPYFADVDDGLYRERVI
jgi:hypothetical protein